MIRVLITTAVMLGMGNLHIPASLGGQVIYFVQRESTQPPGGSPSGRASGSPPDGRAGSTRDSTRQSDIAQGDSSGNIIEDELKATRHSQRTSKRKHDPTTGGGRSPAGFDRRGGAR